MVMGEADEKRLEALKVSLEQARAGTHPRIVAEDKRLKVQQAEKLAKAAKLRDFRLGMVQVSSSALPRQPRAAPCCTHLSCLPARLGVVTVRSALPDTRRIS